MSSARFKLMPAPSPRLVHHIGDVNTLKEVRVTLGAAPALGLLQACCSLSHMPSHKRLGCCSCNNLRILGR